MARNGSGTYTLPATMATANTVSNSATVNSIMSDVATALTDSINKDGTKAFAANQSMGSNKLTSLASGTATTDAANVGQVQAGRVNWADAGGTADAITGTYTPAPTSVTDGDLFFVRASAANATTTPTFTPNSGVVTARTIVKGANTALAAGDINGDGHEIILRYRASDTKYVLLNPYASTPAASDTASGIVELATTTETITGTDATRATTPDSVAALWEKAADVASASTVTFGDGGYFHITGTATITALACTTDKSGRPIRVRFAGALTLTHNATSLILPGGASITTAANDTAEFVSEGSGNFRCISYQKADGTPIVAPASGPTRIYKTANESVTSSVTAQNDDHLAFNMAANTKYQFRMMLFVDDSIAAGSGGLNGGFTGPASPTAVRVTSRTLFSGGANIMSLSYTSTGMIQSNTSIIATDAIIVEGLIQNGANSGTLQFTWAQMASSATATTILAGSYLEYQVVA